MQNMIPFAEYRARRKKFMQNMLPNSIAILPGAPVCERNWENAFPYRQNNDFYYLTGFNEPEAIAVLFDDQFWLFNQKSDPLMETWHGRRAGQDGAEKIYQADKAFDSENFIQHLPALLKNREVLYFAFGRSQGVWDSLINKTINQLRTKLRAGVCVPHTIINPEIYLHEMRLHKSPAEIAVMKKAAQISVNAHIKAMQITQPGQYEYELQAVILETFTREGSLFPAYPPIIGAGENSCILHYSENNQLIKNNDIVLIDAGCEYQNYASDITRSFPANGVFSSAQKAIYDLVLQAQLDALEYIKPGTVWTKMQEVVVKTITTGLVDLGLLKGNVSDLIAEKAYTKFYMHSAGHWLGLDTHDTGNYKPQQEWRKLAPGMVLTIEPGIYISPDKNIDESFWNIGIRIEDDILVTENSHEILTQALPKTIPEIEAVMAG